MKQKEDSIHMHLKLPSETITENTKLFTIYKSEFQSIFKLANITPFKKGDWSSNKIYRPEKWKKSRQGKYVEAILTELSMAIGYLSHNGIGITNQQTKNINLTCKSNCDEQNRVTP